jgi:hypothetical protein
MLAASPSSGFIVSAKNLSRNKVFLGAVHAFPRKVLYLSRPCSCFGRVSVNNPR